MIAHLTTTTATGLTILTLVLLAGILHARTGRHKGNP